MPFIPHTEEDVAAMLASIGASSVDELFCEVPKALLQEPYRNLPEGLSEMAVLQHARDLAEENANKTCFIGAGSYDHHIPAAVWDVASRGEFLTAYTPYQAEVSQGSLQLVYEFQTMISELTGMDVANASMYDGASAASEAALMAVRLNKNSKSRRILVASSIHPFYLETVRTVACNQNIEIISLPFDKDSGRINPDLLDKYSDEDITGLIIASPNFFGCLEQVDELVNWATKHNVISIACVNPVSLALYKPPSEWGDAGVDIVCGEGQPLGAPMGSGGPYFGFFSTKLANVRQLPGRLVGKTQDVDGNTGYTLTLQAREQHIRRAKATSNICTNQGLLVTAATIHMSLLGASGLAEVAKASHANTHYLAEQLAKIPGVEITCSAPYFHEVLITLPKPVSKALEFLAARGINAGYAVGEHFSEYANSLLVCATEKRTAAEINAYVEAMREYIEE